MDPRLGPLDHEALVDTFLDALASVSSTRRMMTLGWRAASIVRVDRRPPLATPSGTIMHFAEPMYGDRRNEGLIAVTPADFQRVWRAARRRRRGAGDG